MTLKTAVYDLGFGIATITDSILAYTTVIRVTVEGLGYNLSATLPAGNRECVFDPALGMLRFTESVDDLTAIGKVFVKYKTV